MAELTFENGVVKLRSRYNVALIAALKAAVPATDRKWMADEKVWAVAPKHAQALVDLVDRTLGERLTVPPMTTAQAVTETRSLEVRYIGGSKDRGAGESLAFGWCGGAWDVVFPEQVLRDWFGNQNMAAPGEAKTLYGVLGLAPNAPGAEVRTAYRRLARQWHPDTCKEPNAADMFRAIHHAYELLSNPAQRARYDAGLTLEATLMVQSKLDDSWRQFTSPLRRGLRQAMQEQETLYRSPLRCGLILATGHEMLGRFQVEKVLAWVDIVDAQGRVLVTSWPKGADHFDEAWATNGGAW